MRIRRSLALVVVMFIAAGCGGGDPISRMRARAQLKQGNESYQRGEHARAVEHFDAALRLVPNFSGAHLGRAYSQVARFRSTVDPAERRRLADEAIASFDAYLRTAPSRPEAGQPSRERIEQLMMTLYIQSEQSPKAMQRLTDRLESDPQDSATLQMLANIAGDAGDVEGALRWLRRRIEVEPHSAAAHHALGAFAWQIVTSGRVDAARVDALLDEGLRAELEAVRLLPSSFEMLTYANLLYREKASRAPDAAARTEFERQADDLLQRARDLNAPMPAP